MKSCVEWRKSFKYKEEVDQFNIDFRNKPDKLNNFLDLYAQSQRVNIKVPVDVSEVELDLLTTLGMKYNIAIVFNWNIKETPQFFSKIQNVKFYSSYQISTWDELLGYISLGVSDVFITGDLCFDLHRVKTVAKEKGVQIRTYANICHNNWENGKITDFFIRPDDIDRYSEFIDVVEFYNSEDRQNVLYNIYFHDKKWNGDLREIIQGLKVRINNYYLIDDEFANRRIDCQKRCLKGEKCNLCNLLVDFANSLEDSKEYDLFIRRDING